VWSWAVEREELHGRSKKGCQKTRKMLAQVSNSRLKRRKAWKERSRPGRGAGKDER
jgi:hypothetical protein